LSTDDEAWRPESFSKIAPEERRRNVKKKKDGKTTKHLEIL